MSLGYVFETTGRGPREIDISDLVAGGAGVVRKTRASTVLPRARALICTGLVPHYRK